MFLFGLLFLCNASPTITKGSNPMDTSNLYYGDEELDCSQEQYDAWIAYLSRESE